MKFITKNTKETQKLAKDLVEKLNEITPHGALVLALQGELGAGKTTFIQSLAKALGVKEKILSPTFVILKRFTIYPLRPPASTSQGRGEASDLCPLASLDHARDKSLGVKFKNFYHLDCYRIENMNDLAGLGFEEILKDKKNLVVIEWAERIKTALPKDAVWMEFEHRGEDNRKIQILNF